MRNIFLSLVLFPILLSCNCQHVQQASYGKLNNRAIPYDSFVIVRRFAIVEVCEDKVCVVQPFFSVSSGAIVKHEKSNSIVLTAGHSCDISYALGMENIKVVHLSIFVLDYEHKQVEASITKVDTTNDICLLRTKSIDRPYVQFSSSGPEIGNEVFNVAAPQGFAPKGVVPIFRGFYCGTDDEFAVYSIFVQPGSSGSIVVKDGKIIGILTRKNVRIENIAKGPTYSSLRDFLKKNGIIQ